MNIAKVEPRDNHQLLVQAENGLTGVFDVSPYLESEVFAPLKEKNNFFKIVNVRYFVELDCGADLSADTIEAKWNIM